MRTLRASALVVAMAVALTACGGRGEDKSNAGAGDEQARTVAVNMVDVAFEPAMLQVARGDKLRFRFTNKGKVAHDAFIGDPDAQADHEAEMRGGDGGGHGGGHGDGAEDAITVEPGDTGELVYTFDDEGTVEVGCHQPAHYAGGMKITVEVT